MKKKIIAGVASVICILGASSASAKTNDLKDQCKNGGWMTLTTSTGASFKNQGDCVSYVNQGGTFGGGSEAAPPPK